MRTTLVVLVVIVVGLVFTFGLLMLYGHKDSTNTPIYQKPS